MLGLMLVIFVIAAAAFLFMGGLRGRRLGWTLSGTIFIALAVIGAMVPSPPPLAACDAGYSRGANGKGSCSMTCDFFKNRMPSNDKESDYYLYCREYEQKQVERMLGGSENMRRFNNLIAETADRQNGFSERDITLRKIERHLR
ncbi:MAG: hypothetical protein QOD40_433 [Alphaproteobacteria bacterium]|jgi:hypothetical protein|nr:hypothetical protein [Alphaproteobacteria bacterium]MEA2991513.1 hypothetical protein [Alphaproteobacteria bacterium]